MSLVVADTSPLHYLLLCDSINVLPELFQEIAIPTVVHLELQAANTPALVKQWARALPDWIVVNTPQSTSLNWKIDPGEMQAIALALELRAQLVLMDDRAGRKAALGYGLVVTGTLGVLELAARAGLLDLPTALNNLRSTNARFAESLLEQALQRDKVRRNPAP